jgi:hypothetical protein
MDQYPFITNISWIKPYSLNGWVDSWQPLITLQLVVVVGWIHEQKTYMWAVKAS